MHKRSDNIRFTSYNDANEVVHKLFESFCSRYQVNFRSGGSYIDSPGWIKKKKTTINTKYEDDKCLFGNYCIKIWRHLIPSRKIFIY